MSLNIKHEINEVLSNDDLQKNFGVGNMGGMRYHDGILLLILDHTKKLYDDRWEDNILYYTGMGKEGDQEFTRGNKRLRDAKDEGTDVLLFEVFKSNEYIYKGPVELCDEYPIDIEEQLDRNGNKRKVIIFPLKGKNSDIIVKKELLTIIEQKKEQEAKKLTEEQLITRIKEHKNKNICRKIETTAYIRNQDIKELCLRRAKGICQLCEKEGPFKKTNDEYNYLESHHIHWLSQGGSDSLDNVVALCPNCHKKMHIINDDNDVEKLKLAVKNSVSQTL